MVVGLQTMAVMAVQAVVLVLRAFQKLVEPQLLVKEMQEEIQLHSIGLVVAVVVFLTSEPGKQFVAFGRDSWREVKKVVWPERKEAIQITLYVFGFVVVMALFLWLVDKSLEWVLYDLILGWKK